MSTYNASRYVREAINSVLNQTFRDFEFLIIDDASADDTWAVLGEFSKCDRRIRLWRNDYNLGLADSLNRLIGFCRGEYIARMDGDDVSLVDRFERQVSYMDAKGLDVLGGWVRIFGGDVDVVEKYPEHGDAIRAGLLFEPMFAHPAVMIRKSCLGETRYDASVGIVEDYDLWCRLAPRARMANLQTVVLNYRRHSAQSTIARVEEQLTAASVVSLRYLDSLSIQSTAKERQIHASVRSPMLFDDQPDICATEKWLCRLVEHYAMEPESQSVLAGYWYRYCLKAAGKGPKVWFCFIRSDLSKYAHVGVWQKLIVMVLSFSRISYDSRLFAALKRFKFFTLKFSQH